MPNTISPKWLRPSRGLSHKNLIIFALFFAAIGAIFIYKSLASEQVPALANVWISNTGNDSSCNRSASSVAYGGTVACASFQRACEVATGGDMVGVKSGTYYGDQYSRYINGTDCSNGQGIDIDPTSLPAGTDPVLIVESAKWVTFFCGDGETRDTVKGGLTSGFDVNANAHAFFHGNCFYWTNLLLGEGGQSSYETQNVIVDGWHIEGWEIIGAKNIWMRNIENGPGIECGDSSYAAQYRCQDPGYGVFESKWAKANLTSTEFKNGQGFIHQNKSVPAQNILVENLWEHDQQSRRSSGPDGGWHTGCLQIDNVLQAPLPTDNITLRNFTCERITHIGPLIGEGTSGVTIENWKVACPVEPLDNNTGQWATPSCSQPGVTLQSQTGNHSNILIRYNDFSGIIRTGNLGSLSGKNVRVIGNIAAGYQCTSGVFYDYNVVQTASPCGTNQVVQNPYPVVSQNPGTDCCSGSPVANFQLSGNFAWENSITPTTSDYTLNIDSQGQVRNTPRTPGVDERDISSPPTPKPADLNSDGVVNITDLSILLSSWNTTNSTADINKDGTVNILDLSILLSNYGA